MPLLDIDECAQNATLCGQLCVNTDGSYFCSCEDGYELVEGTTQCRGEKITYICKYLVHKHISFPMQMQTLMNVLE